MNTLSVASLLNSNSEWWKCFWILSRLKKSLAYCLAFHFIWIPHKCFIFEKLCHGIKHLWFLPLNFNPWLYVLLGFLGGSYGKEPDCNARDLGSIPGSERSLREGNDYPLQYFCLENSMNRGAWWAAVYRVANSRTWWLTNTYWASYLYILIRESQLGWHLSILLMIMWK